MTDKKGSQFHVVMAQVLRVAALAMAVFHIYTCQFGVFTAMVQRPVHLTFACILTLLGRPISSKYTSQKYPLGFRFLDIALCGLTIWVMMHLANGYRALVMRGGEATTMDLWMGAAAIGLVLECTRRLMGSPLVIITGFALLFNLLGHHIPGHWGHGSLDLEQILSYQYLTTEGLFGIPLGVSATFIFIFIMFGAFLVKSGTGEFFMNFANALAGHFRGGPAKVAVISSAFFGTISGSAVANVVSTGSFTIPLMKKIGYRPQFAGAVEAVASTGGQIMPPVMGAAAFIMADMLGIPYFQVCKGAILPACLYYFALLYMVHLEALRWDLRGMAREDLPLLGPVLRQGGHLLLPAFFLITILTMGYSAMKSGLWAVGAVLVVSWFRRGTRMGWRQVLDAMERGAKGCLEVALACACAGIVIGTITQTGLGLKFSSLVIEAAGGRLALSLVFVMIASLVLGLGLTTSAAYILTVIMGGPVLINLGVDPLAAHLFVFYYACLSVVTPPEAMAAYAAAAIAGSKPLRTGWEATRLAAIAYIAPFFFVYSPELILKGHWWNVVQASITAMLGCMALGSSLMGQMMRRLGWASRVLLLAAGLGLIKPGLFTDIFGAVVLGGVFVLQRRQGAALSTAPEPDPNKTT
ncbi:MAG: TRAP transporter permease [Deltaproteobacteria bacterium]|nr:TRAP transporter permease [Deltaproteobacteria bacterium]